MRISCFDTETLTNNSRQPHLMVVDEIAGLSVEVENQEAFLKLNVNLLLDCLESFDLAKVDVAKVLNKGLKNIQHAEGVSVTYFNSTLRVLDQVVSGRTLEAATIAWHAKNGVDVESKLRPTVDNKTTLTDFNAWLAGSNAVFTRGNDFDVTLLGSICKELGVKEGFKYNSVRDIRTACDELLNDFEYSTYVRPERVANSSIGKEYPAVVTTVERIQKLRKHFGHRALYDAIFDLCLYVVLKQSVIKGI